MIKTRWGEHKVFNTNHTENDYIDSLTNIMLSILLQTLQAIAIKTLSLLTCQYQTKKSIDSYVNNNDTSYVYH